MLPWWLDVCWAESGQYYKTRPALLWIVAACLLTLWPESSTGLDSQVIAPWLALETEAVQVLNELFKEPDSVFNKRIEMRPEVYQMCKKKTKVLMKHFYGIDIDVDI